MKVISFLSKFTLICNLAFLVFIFFNLHGSPPPGSGAKDIVFPIPFFKDVIIILGFSAIVVNSLMCLTYAFFVLSGKSRLLPKWVALLNFLFILVEFYFYFFNNHR